jgi:hypothetical protein
VREGNRVNLGDSESMVRMGEFAGGMENVGGRALTAAIARETDGAF